MDLLFEIRILDYNIQDHDPNAQVKILMLELWYQRPAQCISYDDLLVISFITRYQESRP